jgi:uncharacterized repeat protein (TIGR01451 family)
MKTKLSKAFSFVMILALVLPMAAFAQSPAPPTDALTAQVEESIYLVRLADAPLAAYQGDLAGLEATSPKVTGENKLDVNTTASQRYLNYLAGVQNIFVAEAEALLGRGVEVVYNYRIANNGLAVKLTPAEAALVAKLDGVVFVQPDFERELHTDASVAFVGAPGIWDGSTTAGLPGTYGEGMIIGVIDTGIVPGNPSFADMGGDGYDHTNPWGAGVYAGVCDPANAYYDDTFPCNDKLIGAYGYAGNDGEARDYNGHGSHTASTAGGNFVDITDPVSATISGVAPHANIIAYGSCCSGSDLAASIDDAIADGVDVINYSIGSDAGSDIWNDFDTVGYLNAREAGVFVATSAGNNGPGYATIGSPADAPWLTAAGNAINVRVFANSAEVTGPGTVPAELQDLAALQGGDSPDLVEPLENDIVYAGDVDPDNITGCDAFPTDAFSDAIALIQRGDCTFATKEANAADAGAVALVVFNHSAGPPTVMGGLAGTIPAYMISLDDGLAVVDWIQANTDPTFQINMDLEAVGDLAWGDLIAQGSSRGPNQVLPGIVKPDVAAPGTNILAAYGTGDTVGWDFLSGTSMASPHVAGGAALLMSLHPDWTPAEVQSALTTTAWDDMLKDDGLTHSDPFDVGGGRIQLGAAAQAGLVLDETIANYWAADPEMGGDPLSLNLASVGNGSCVGMCGWERTVRSTLAVSQTWDVIVDMPPTVTIEVDPMTFTLAPGMEQTLVITAETAGAEIDEWYFGSIIISPTTSLRAPDVPLFYEDFDGGTFPPTGWTVLDNDGSGLEWDAGSTCGYTNETGGAGDFADANSDCFGSASYDTELQTPSIDLSSLVEPVLKFKSAYENYASNDSARVLISDDGGTTWDQLLEWNEDQSGPQSILLPLDAYAGSSVIISFQYDSNGNSGWYWYWQIDDVSVDNAPPPPPPAHMPLAVRPADSSLPELVTIVTDQYTGTETVAAIQVLDEITDLTTMSYGLAAADLMEDYLFEDPTNGDPFDNPDDVMWFTLEVPTETMRLVAEVVKTTSPDLDLFVGTGDTPSADTQVDYSASGGSMEYVNIDDPAAGTWWVLVQNWEGSAEQPDRAVIAAGLVGMTDAGNMTVDGPAAVPSGTPFDLDVEWDEMDMLGLDRWYGAFSLGTDAANPGNVGVVNVDLQFQGTRIDKAAPPMVGENDTFTYQITVDTELPIGGTMVFSDVLPAGVEFVSGTLTSTVGTAWYDDGDNAVYWSTVAMNLQAPEAPNVVLWEQVADGTGQGIISDYFTDNGLGTYAADDFVIAYPVTLESIFVDGFVNTDDLTDATAVTWVIYPDASGEPAGYPSDGGGTEIWSFTTAVTDTAVTINNDAITLDLVAAEGAGLDLEPGTYWLSFFPDMDLATYQRFNWYRGATTNGAEALLYDDGIFGGFDWTTISSLVGEDWHDKAFRLDGTINVPDFAVVSFDVEVTGEPGDLITNTVMLDDNGDMFYASAETMIVEYMLYMPLLYR